MTGSKKEMLNDLVDIRNIEIDRSKPLEDRIKEYIKQIKDPYHFKVGNTVVRVSYADNNTTINDSFANLIASM